MLVLVVFAMPCVIGQLLSRSEPLLHPDRRTVSLVAFAVTLQLAASVLPGYERVMVPASFGLGLIALTVVVWKSSRQYSPTLLAAMGAVANFIPIAWHGAMPVRATSRAAISASQIAEPDLIAAKHVERQVDLSWTNPMSLLTDWIPVPGAVISIGDVLLLAAFLSLGAMAHRRERSNPVRTQRKEPSRAPMSPSRLVHA